MKATPRSSKKTGFPLRVDPDVVRRLNSMDTADLQRVYLYGRMDSTDSDSLVLLEAFGGLVSLIEEYGPVRISGGKAWPLTVPPELELVLWPRGVSVERFNNIDSADKQVAYLRGIQDSHANAYATAREFGQLVALVERYGLVDLVP